VVGEARNVALGYTQGMVRFAQIAALIFVASGAFADVADEVRCQEIAFSRSVENKNIESFRSFLDGDARFVGRAVDRGPDEISASWRIFFSDDGPNIKWRPQFVEVALTRGPYRMIAEDADGNPVESWGTFNSVWRKNADGEWLIIFDAGSNAATPPDEETQALLDQEDDC
jgi:ketosteroid isomerase-like protein